MDPVECRLRDSCFQELPVFSFPSFSPFYPVGFHLWSSFPIKKYQNSKQICFAGLRCFSCGSLLDPNRQCDAFNPKDVTQVQTCGHDEACLLYTWKKSNTEKGLFWTFLICFVYGVSLYFCKKSRTEKVLLLLKNCLELLMGG